MIHKSFRAHGEYRSSTRAELRDTQMRSRGSSFCRRVMATTNSTAVDMTEVRQIKAQSLGAAAIAKAFGIGRFIRGAKPQAGLRQTDYFDEVIKRVSLCASAGGAAFSTRAAATAGRVRVSSAPVRISGCAGRCERTKPRQGRERSELKTGLPKRLVEISGLNIYHFSNLDRR